MLRDRISIRAGIVGLFTFLIVLTGVVITSVAYFGSKRSVHIMAENIMMEITGHVVDKTRNYLEPAEKFSFLTQRMVSTGRLQSEDKNMLAYFRDLLMVNPNFVNVYWGQPDGSFSMVKRMPDGSISNKLVTPRGDTVVSTWQHSNPQYSANFKDTTVSQAKGYDPRKRPWYSKAIGSNLTCWTDIYFFSSDGKPGITNAMAVYSPSSALLGVIGIDMGMAEISYFLSSLKIGDTGKAFLTNSEHNLVAKPIQDETEMAELYLKIHKENGFSYKPLPMTEVQDDLLRESYQAHIKLMQENPLGAADPKPLMFDIEGESHLALFSALPADSGMDWMVGIVLPEREIMRLVYENNQLIFSISAILILVTGFLGFKLSRIIALPLTLLCDQMEKVRKFDLDVDNLPPSPLREVDIMTQSFHDMSSGLKSFQKFVDRDVVVELINNGQEAKLGGEKKEITCLFTDIANFTKISEILTGEELVQNLAIYFGEINKIIVSNKGTVDKYVGDMVMAFWGAPSPLDDQAVFACRAALQARHKLPEISHTLAQAGHPPFNTRFGLNTGEAIVGNMGSEERLNYTALGDNVNLSSRLESLNKYYGTTILISENTYNKAKDHFEVRELDIVVVKGKTKGVAIYELLAEKDNLSEFMHDFLGLFEEGFMYYRQKEWANAAKVFGEALKLAPSDKPTAILLDRCRGFKKDPPPEDWTGVITMR